MKTFFSIRYKFLFVTTLLLLLCVSAYLFMAIKVFKQDKTELVYDYNKNIVTTLNSDFSSLISRVRDRIELYPYFSDKNELQNFIRENSEIVYLAKSEKFEQVDSVLYFDKNFIKNYRLEGADELLSLVSKNTLFKEHLRQGESLWTLGKENKLPLIGYSKMIIEYNQKKQPINQYSLVALIKVEKLYNLIAQNSYSSITVLSPSGDALIGNLDEDIHKEIIKNVVQKAVNTSVIKFKHEGMDYLGAYSKLDNGSLIISNVNSDRAFKAVDLLVYRSVLFASIVVTLAFIVTIFFSKSLTKPIEILMKGMLKVSKGQLDTKINVETKDEIRALAQSFNKMIQELKKSRNDLEEANKNLEFKVIERTEQLEKQNQAVKRAQEAMLKTSRLAAVGEIAGRAAHEVLNPLTNIINRTQILKNKNQFNDQVQTLQEIRQAWEEEYKSKNFNGLIESWKQPSQIYEGKTLWEEDLLNLKKIEESIVSNENLFKEDIRFLIKESARINKIVQSMRSMSKIKNEVRSHNINELIVESINIMADLASRHNVKISFNENSSQVRVRVDLDEFIQSLTNLIRNSIQAITEKAVNNKSLQGIIKISLIPNENNIEIHITDNGMGISPEDKEKLFKTQFTTKTNGEGTGLGLTISRRFLRSFNGDILLMHTELGIGTTMVVQLPMENSERIPA
ncbi:MAG: HAMP domain-containing protein [Bdellovibrionaceae bacterium]|nr:HAMP domain-containing protein [Pseudobdellovibrionaceae bacterium]